MSPVFRSGGARAKVALECVGARGQSRRHGNPRAARAALRGGKCGCCGAGDRRGCDRRGARRAGAARAAAGRDPGRGVRAFAVEGRPGQPRGDGEGTGQAGGDADGRARDLTRGRRARFRRPIVLFLYFNPLGYSCLSFLRVRTTTEGFVVVFFLKKPLTTLRFEGCCVNCTF